MGEILKPLLVLLNFHSNFELFESAYLLPVVISLDDETMDDGKELNGLSNGRIIIQFDHQLNQEIFGALSFDGILIQFGDVEWAYVSFG